MSKHEAFANDDKAAALVKASADLAVGRDTPMTPKDLLSAVGMEAGQISRVQMLKLIETYPDGEKVKGLLNAMVDACIDAQRKEGKLANIREEDLPRYKELFAKEFVDDLRSSVQRRGQLRSEAPRETQLASADLASLVPENLRDAITRSGLGAPVQVSREMVESQNVQHIAQRDEGVQRA